jgi:hypothetical protein
VSGIGIEKRIHQTYNLVDSEEEKSEIFSFLSYFNMKLQRVTDTDHGHGHVIFYLRFSNLFQVAKKKRTEDDGHKEQGDHWLLHCRWGYLLR